MLQFQHLELHHGCEVQESWILNVLFVANYAFFERQLDPLQAHNHKRICFRSL